MAARRLTGFDLRPIRTLYHLGSIGLLTDGQLLERFATGNGEPAELAFAALIERHGPMVLGVCRAVLGDNDAARDAFQATFLILLHKAKSLWVQDSLGSWLHRVAYRAAQNTRSAAKRRRFHERCAAELRAASAQPTSDGDDLTEALHQEMERLPIRFRIPLLLCDLEGRTHEEAARLLGCPVGTVKSRLARAREKLRGRLVRRGIGISTGAILALAAKTAGPSIPHSLVTNTIEIVKHVAASKAIVGTVPAASVILARGVLRTMFQTKLTMAVAIAIAIGSLALGIGAIKGQVEGAPLRREGAPPQQVVVQSRTITIHVVDEDGKPVQAARVFRNHVYKLDDGGRPSIENKDYRTGADGKALVALSATSVDLRLWASKAHFVPLFAIWAKDFQSDGDQIPEEFTFRLQRGTEIGGSVVDERGKPIGGVKVEVQDRTADHFHSIPLQKTPGQRPVRVYSLAEGAESIVTDERGRWKLGNVPADKDLVFDPRTLLAQPIPLEIELHISHPDYISDEIKWGVLQRQQDVTLKSLREQTAKIVLVKK